VQANAVAKNRKPNHVTITGHGTFAEHGAGIGVRSANGACQRGFKLNYVVTALAGTAVTPS